MADRLDVSKNVAEDLANNIDRVDMLGMKVGSTQRYELLEFAMALGLAKGERTSLISKKGFVQDSSFRNKPFESYLYSVALNELRKDNKENLISNSDVVYEIVEEYAQTGFDEIRSMFGDFSEYDEEDCIDRMIEKMDEMYAAISESKKDDA